MKALREERGDLVEKIDETKKRLSGYARELAGLDLKDENRDEKFAELKEKLDADEVKLSGYEADLKELDGQIAIAKKASVYADPQIDPSRSAGTDGGRPSIRH